jgi:hypothetical protein
MQKVPRNKKSIIKHFCRRYFHNNISGLLTFTSAYGERAVICIFKSKHRLIVWYDALVGRRVVVAIAVVNGQSLRVEKKSFETIKQLKHVLVILFVYWIHIFFFYLLF